MNDTTVCELQLIMDKVRSELAGGVSRRQDTNWRYCFVGHSSGEVPAASTALSRFIRKNRESLTFKGWQCEVFAVRRWPSAGQEILCATSSHADWDFSVFATFKAKRLERGDLIELNAINVCAPSPGEDLKIAFAHGASINEQTTFTVLRKGFPDGEPPR